MDNQPDFTRTLMCATITDTRFLKGLRQLWRDDLVGSSWRWLAARCFDYFEKYGEAPGRNIETIWAAEKPADPEAHDELARLLSSLSDEWEREDRPNPDMLLDQARRMLAAEALIRGGLQVAEAAEAGDIEKAEELHQAIWIPHLWVEEAIDPADHPDLIKAAFERAPESLVDLGGAYQELVGSQMVRDSFVAFVGKEKVGKSQIMRDLVFHGLKARRNVLYYIVGDMSREQVILRMAIQLAGRSNRIKYNGPLYAPILDCILNQKGTCERKERQGCGQIVDDGRTQGKAPYPYLRRYEDADGYQPCQVRCWHYQLSTWQQPVSPCSDLTWEQALFTWKRYQQAFGSRLRMECFPKGSASISGLKQRAERLRDQGFNPELVIIDYMDNLAAEPGTDKKEFRHQEDNKWGAARAWSQEDEICIIGATQCPKKTRFKRLVSDEDISEDKRKKAHVTSMFGLNRDDHDKRMGWMRVNPLALREDEFSMFSQVAVFQLLQRGQPNLGSHWSQRGEEE